MKQRGRWHMRDGIRSEGRKDKVRANWLTALATVGSLLVLLVFARSSLGLLTQPNITVMTPRPGETVTRSTTTIRAQVVGSRPLQYVHVLLNGQEVQPAVYTVSAQTWRLEYETALSAGQYTVTVIARDDQGHTSQRSWSFSVANSASQLLLQLREPLPTDRYAAGIVPILLTIPGDLTPAIIDLRVDGEPILSPTWQQDTTSHVTVIRAVASLTPGTHELAAAITTQTREGATGRWNITVVADPASATARYFAETGQVLRGAFKRFWESHNGAALFGPPISPELATSDGRLIQYCVNARLELHHDGTVTLGLLGIELRGHPDPAVTDPHQPGVLYFPETGHTLSGIFRTFWEQNGGLAIFGFPISEQIREGDHWVQYFERARFERPVGPESTATVTLAPLGAERWQREANPGSPLFSVPAAAARVTLRIAAG